MKRTIATFLLAMVIACAALVSFATGFFAILMFDAYSTGQLSVVLGVMIASTFLLRYGIQRLDAWE
jgi:hypothetical protein